MTVASNTRCWSRALPAFVALVAVGCADNPPAPIETRSAITGSAKPNSEAPVVADARDHPSDLVPGEPYTVVRGDTLYSIAFRLGLDYRALALANDISPPYTIYPGQRLNTVPDSRVAVSPEPNPPVAATDSPKVATASQAAPAAKPSSPVPAQSTPKPTPKPEPKTARGDAQSTAVVVKKAPKATPEAKPAPKPSPPPTIELGPVSRWLWPSSGGVERAFSSVLHKGIDIAGKRGDPVTATAAGVVVYAGTGLTGYGALLIVKHNEQFLSAYGHNDAMLVAEGTEVRAGQQIATMGSTGTDTVKLHFEIRRQGTPVDPLRLLPKR